MTKKVNSTKIQVIIKPGSMNHRIYALIQDRGEMTLSEVIQCGIKRGTASTTLCKLEKAGFLTSKREYRLRRVWYETKSMSTKIYSINHNKVEQKTKAVQDKREEIQAILDFKGFPENEVFYQYGVPLASIADEKLDEVFEVIKNLKISAKFSRKIIVAEPKEPGIFRRYDLVKLVDSRHKFFGQTFMIQDVQSYGIYLSHNNYRRGVFAQISQITHA